MIQSVEFHSPEWKNGKREEKTHTQLCIYYNWYLKFQQWYVSKEGLTFDENIDRI